MADDDERIIPIPVDLTSLPPQLQQAIGEVLQEMFSGGSSSQAQVDDDDDESPSLGEIVFKVDRMIEDGNSEPRMAMMHARVCPLDRMITNDLDETLGRLHSFEEAITRIENTVKERVAFVESVRPALKHPDEIVKLFETDLQLNELFFGFFAQLREFLRVWKEKPLYRPNDDVSPKDV